MEYKYSSVIDSSMYDTQGLCHGIDLRRHVAGDLEEVGALRVQEDWRRLVGPLEKPFKGGLGPHISFITCAVPECLPDRLEICSAGLEFGFIHDDEIDKNIHHASLDEMEQALEQVGRTGKIEDKGASGKRKIAARILREMMAIDPVRAKVVAKSWATGVQHSSRRQEDTNFRTLEEYIPYRSLDVGYMLWHGLVTFGCAITIPEEEEEETKKLLQPALITAALTNDLFSFEKERNDVNVQNAILIVTQEHRCSEKESREILKSRIRAEVATYIQVVKETRTRNDLSDDVKRYIEVMQYTLSGNVAWSTQCPRYNAGAQWNELQLLRAEHGVEKYPATWPTKTKIDALSAGAQSIEPQINLNGIRQHEPNKPNGLKRKKSDDSMGDELRMTSTHGPKKSAQITQPGTDSLISRDVMSLAIDLNLPDLNDNAILEPYRYLTSLPSKGLRDLAIDSLNTWLKVPQKSANIIKTVISALHNASLMLDDLEDGSPLRRGKLSTHNVYGAAQTINSATFQYIQATDKVTELSDPSCFRIFISEMQQLYVGQSYDLYWTHNALCPSISEYLKMVDKKTGGLFRMLTRLMVVESALSEKVSETHLNLLSCLIGRFFQIRDDYQNLASADYAKQKGFAEDLDEGKYSFTLIHCIQTLESDIKFTGEAMQLRALLMKRRSEGKLGHEAKQAVLAIIDKTKSLDYTFSVLVKLHGELKMEVGRLEGRFGEENFLFQMLLEMLKP